MRIALQMVNTDGRFLADQAESRLLRSYLTVRADGRNRRLEEALALGQES